MTKVAHPHHRSGRGSPSMKLDPYNIDEMTITLEEFRRLRCVPAPAKRRARSVRRPAAAA